MVTKDEIKNDNRFFIDDWNLDRIMRRPVLSYEICPIKLGNIWRIINRTPIPLCETDIYKYLDGSAESRKNYEDYCSSPLCEGNSYRGVEVYNSLIHTMETTGYDMKKGAVFVDQLNFIQEGQHRSCILLHNYGPEYKIDVVKIHYQGLYIRTRFKKSLAMLKFH